jgi:hypothetical protein
MVVICASNLEAPMAGRPSPALLSIALAATLIATTPSGAVQFRVPKCVCINGYEPRLADKKDYVCVSEDDAGLTRKQNRHAAIHRVSETDITCLSGYVWRDAFDGDSVCVPPETRDKAHYQNEHWGANADGVSSGNLACLFAPQ